MAESVKDLVLQYSELANNPTARVPLVICVDTSGSMKLEDRIGQLNQGLKSFAKALRNDDTAVDAAEVCLVSFGGQARVVCPFTGVEKLEIPTLEAKGLTPLGSAVLMGLDQLKTRLEYLDGIGVDYFVPWLIIMSDGEETDPAETRKAIDQVQQMARAHRLKVLPVAIVGEKLREDGHLERFSPEGEVSRLSALKFKMFFTWLSQCVQSVSGSTPGGSEPPLPPADWSDDGGLDG